MIDRDLKNIYVKEKDDLRHCSSQHLDIVMNVTFCIPVFYETGHVMLNNIHHASNYALI